MSVYSPLILTSKGEDLISASIAGKKLIITKAEYGSGTWNSKDEIKNADKLKDPRLALPPGPITTIDGDLVIQCELTNDSVTVGFILNEIGVFAKLEGDKEEHLLGISYSTDPNKSEYIPSIYESYTDLLFKFILHITDAKNVTISLGALGDYVRGIDLQAHNESDVAHMNLQRKLIGVSWFFS